MRKLFVMVCCALFVVIGLSGATVEAVVQEKNIEKETLVAPALVFGFMKTLDTTPGYRDYEVKLFAVVVYGGETFSFSRGEFIRLYNFKGLDLIFIVAGSCDDWAVIG
ncbi:MAG TPA: hypothetical protein ENI42_07010 [Thermoplasmatales archaeon]|nr:hypothetical protein [Thermoplasmatales archaeon]